MSKDSEDLLAQFAGEDLLAQFAGEDPPAKKKKGEDPLADAAGEVSDDEKPYSSNSWGDTLARGGKGFAKGVMDVADTVASKVIAPATTFIDNKLFGSQGGAKREEDLNKRIKQENEDFERDYGDSSVAGIARIGGNIVASLPAFELAGGGAMAALPYAARIPGIAQIASRIGRARNAVNLERTAGVPAGKINKMISAGSTGAGLSAGGAGIGAIGNVATSASNDTPVLEQAEHGAKVGAVLGPLGPAAYKVGEKVAQAGYRMAEPFFERGQEKIANRLIQNFAEGGPMPPAASRNADEIIPGSKPTLATATENPGLATLERGVRDSNPGSVNKFTELDRENTAARNREFGARKGDETTLETLRKDREIAGDLKRDAAFKDTNVKPAEAKPVLNMIERELKGPNGKRDAVVQALNEVKSKLVKPYPLEERVGEAVKGINDAIKSGKMSANRTSDFAEARRLLNSARRGNTSEEDLVRGLNALAKKQKTVSAIDDALATIKKGDTRLETDPEMLYGVRKAIGDSLSKNAKGTPADRSLAAKELKAVQESLDRVMEKAAPGFKEYLKTYAEKSKPIDTQKVLQKMNLTDQEGNVMGQKLDSAIKQIEQRRKMPGAQPEKSLDQATMDFLYNLREDFRRAGKLKLGSPKGSPTFQNLATSSAIGDIMGPLSLVAGHNHGVLLKLASYLYKGADKSVMDKVTNKLLDPRFELPPTRMRVHVPVGQRLTPKVGVAGATRLLSAPNTP